MIASIFNSYFACIGSSVSNNVKQSSKHFTNYLNNRTINSTFFLPTNENEIIKVVRPLRNTSSAGHDEISVTFIKKVIFAIAKPLSSIFNMSISTGIVPDPLKLANVIPVYKKGNNNIHVHVVENYRPISLLPTFPKILERIIHNRLFMTTCFKTKSWPKNKFVFGLFIQLN